MKNTKTSLAQLTYGALCLLASYCWFLAYDASGKKIVAVFGLLRFWIGATIIIDQKKRR